MKSNLANLVITFRLFFTQNPGDPNNHSWSNKQTYHLQCHTFDPTKTPLTTNDLVPMSTNQSLFICGPGVIGFWILTEKQKSYFEKNGINLRKTGEIFQKYTPVLADIENSLHITLLASIFSFKLINPCGIFTGFFGRI